MMSFSSSTRVLVGVFVIILVPLHQTKVIYNKYLQTNTIFPFGFFFSKKFVYKKTKK